jgi:hypothetical protein
MIGNDVIQAAIIARLKADTTLTDWLVAQNSADDEIREIQWQGTVFDYPAVRASISDQLPDVGGGTCYLTAGEFTFTAMAFSESDSSQQADQLMKLVNDALIGKRLSGTGFKTMVIQNDGMAHASRTGERIWSAAAVYRANLYETT